MKHKVTTLILMLLIVAMAVTAMAEVYRYSTQKDVKVYETRSLDAKVIRKLSKDEKVILEVDQKEIKDWLGILCTASDGSHMIGWVQRQYLTDHLHSWGKWKTTKKATCTKEGQKERACKICGRTQSKKIPKADHEYGKWTVLRQPTCTSKGERKHTCKNCGHEERASIKMVPHDYGAWKVIVATTDHSSGVREHACQNCGHSERVSFDPEGTLRRKAKGSAVRELQQLLVDQGYLKSGGVDGTYGGGTEKAIMQFQKDQGLEPDGIAWPQTLQRLRHDYGEWEAVVALTRAADGEWVRVCKDCGHEDRMIVKAEPTLSRKQKGGAVKAVQKMLGDLGFSAGKADGAYGPKLDSAFEAFAEANGLTFNANRIFPADADALMRAWIQAQPEESWMGQGDKDSAVNLILRVTPSRQADEDTPDGMLRFDWTVSNLGSQKCSFRALLMGKTSDDIMENGMVGALDWIELKANGKNSASGTLFVSADWASDDGILDLCAVATQEKTGEHWTSNVSSCNLNG